MEDRGLELSPQTPGETANSEGRAAKSAASPPQDTNPPSDAELDRIVDAWPTLVVPLWRIQALGSVVTFVAESLTAPADFALYTNGTVAGTFTVTRNATANNDVYVARSGWDDPLDGGSGSASGFELDVTQYNAYKFEYGVTGRVGEVGRVVDAAQRQRDALSRACRRRDRQLRHHVFAADAAHEQAQAPA